MTGRIVEGLGVPFGAPRAMHGKDTYRTYFSARTDLALDTTAADGSGPLLWQHGMDPAVGLMSVGRWTPVRTDKRGVWVRAELDPKGPFTEPIGEALDAGLLGFSPGSAEHSVEVGPDGMIRQWPLWEVSLTPTPSNPLATARSADLAVRVYMGPPEGGKPRKDIPEEDFAGPNHSFPIVKPASVSDAAKLVGHAADPEEVKAHIIAIARRKGPKFVVRLPKKWQSETLIRVTG